MLLFAKQNFHKVQIRAIIDDRNLWGPLAATLDCFEHLCTDLVQIPPPIANRLV